MSSRKRAKLNCQLLSAVAVIFIAAKGFCYHLPYPMTGTCYDRLFGNNRLLQNFAKVFKMKSSSMALKLERSSKNTWNNEEFNLYGGWPLSTRFSANFFSMALWVVFQNFLAASDSCIPHTLTGCVYRRGFQEAGEFKTVNPFCCLIFCLCARRKKMVPVKSEN